MCNSYYGSSGLRRSSTLSGWRWRSLSGSRCRWTSLKGTQKGKCLEAIGNAKIFTSWIEKKLFVQVLLPYRVCNLPERERAKRFWAELRSLAGHQVLDQFQRTHYTGISSFNHLSHFLPTSFLLMPNCTEYIIYVKLNYPDRNLLWNFQGWDPWDHC